MKQIIAAILFLFCLGASAEAACVAPCTKAQLATDIATAWPDNTTAQITPALLRAPILEIVNSYLDLNGTSSSACVASRWISAFANLSSFTCTQPAFTDISGVLVGAQLPAPTAGTLGGVFSSSAPANQFQNGINTSGAPTYAQPAFSNLSGTSGINSNTLLTKAGNYTIANTDCGKTISGTGGPWTLTLPAVSGFDGTCSVRACNADANDVSHHAVLLSGFPQPIFARLYMQQCVTIAIVNGAWTAINVPGRFRPNFTPTIYFDNSGSDNNDGLVSNAAANALASGQKCVSILQNEYDLIGTQPVCSPTSGQTIVGSINVTGGLVGSIALSFVGNGGVATLRPTASGAYLLQIADSTPGIISQNITWDCTGGSATCVNWSMHQINQGSDINSGTTFIGNAAGHVAINCDSRCRINGQSLLTFSGSFNNLMVGQFDAQFNISAGVTLANNTTLAGAIFSLTLGSKLAFAGALTSGGTVTIADNLVMKSNSIACFSGFTTSGTFTGAREFVVVGGSVLNNSSANRLPHAGSSGIVTATGFNAGFAPDNAAGNTGVNSGAC